MDNRSPLVPGAQPARRQQTKLSSYTKRITGEDALCVFCTLHARRCGHNLEGWESAAEPHRGAQQYVTDNPSENELAPSVRLENVVKRFGDFTAVRNLTLDIERGE